MSPHSLGKHIVWTSLVLCLGVIGIPAGEGGAPAEDEEPTRLASAVQGVTARVEALEGRVEAPSATDLADLERRATELQEEVDAAGEGDGSVGAAQALSARVRVLELWAFVESWNAVLEQVESSAAAPERATLDQLDEVPHELLGRIARAEAQLGDEVSEQATRVLDLANESFDRTVLLSVNLWFDKIRPSVEELEARQQPPTEEELKRLRGWVDELVGGLESLKETAEAVGFRMSSAKSQRQVKALSKTIDTLSEAASEEDVAQKTQQEKTEPDAPSEEERAELESRLGKIESASTPTRKAIMPYAGIRRARSILARMTALSVYAASEKLRPSVEMLEQQEEAPTGEQLEPLLPRVQELAALIEEYGTDIERLPEAPLPPVVATGLDLLLRFANMDLRSSMAALEPLIVELTGRKDPPTKQEADRLRQAPVDMRPKIRTILRLEGQEGVGGEETVPPDVRQARELLKRAATLVPQDPTQAEEPGYYPETQPVVQPFRFYGSLRFRNLWNSAGQYNFDEASSRVGIRAEYRIPKLPKELSVLGRLEVGVNLLGTLEDLEEEEDLGGGGDPGFDVTDLKKLLPLRLLFIGIKSPYGNLTAGKQWSAWWDLAVFTDQLPYFSGAGNVTFNAGTDGGVAGTGRADQALQYRNSIEPFKFTVQTQHRNLTNNDAGLVDTYGLSLIYLKGKLDAGLAYNKVLDGVPDPDEGQPRQGDESLIVGARWRNEPLYAALNLSLFKNHETDDLDRFFSGYGIEAYADYKLLEKLKLLGNFSLVRPESKHPGEFLIRTAAFGISYDVVKLLRVWVLGQLDRGKNSDGSRVDGERLAISLHINF